MSKSTAPRRSGGPTRQVALRLPPDVLRGAAALRPRIAARPDVAVLGRVTATTVLKLALARGLDALEQEYR